MHSFNTYWVAKQQRRELAAAIMQLRKNKLARHRFFNLLRQANLLLPVAKLPPTYEIGDLVDHKNVPLQMSLAKTSTGKPYLAVYTSEEELRRHHPEPRYVIVPFHLLAQVALKTKITGIIIDRNSPTSTTLPLSILQTLVPPKAAERAHTRLQSVPSSPQISLGPPPRIMSQGEIVALHRYFKAQKGVIKAYLFGLVEGKNKEVLIVGLRYTMTPTKERLQQMMQEVRSILGHCGILLLNEQREANLAHQPGVICFDVEKAIERIYK